ncbi:MAG TPA: hypothetical protein VEK08_21410 [Planctomycetota bacterium]|nr:hypothetical protein [Planctomycetota bacterium]
MKNTFLILFISISINLFPLTGGEPASAENSVAVTEVFTFAELLIRAERIVVAEAGEMKDGVVTLLVRETIKSPEDDAKYVDPERLKRAADLLNNEKLDLPPLAAKPRAPATLKLKLQNIAAPRAGVQAIYFLWERAEGGAREPVYRLSHPQNVYDVELLAQVKAGASRPRSVADGRYLRDWDKLMAERKKQRAVNQDILNLKGGESVLGLKIRAARPVLSLRGNNSFGITAIVENTRGRDQDIYDGPAGGYGVIIRAKEGRNVPGLPLVLRQSTKTLGADLTVLNMADLTDFTTVPRDSAISKELFFDSQDFPILTTLKGECTISVFFATAQNGKGLELSSPVWTGTMVSEELPLRFESPEANASTK